MERNYWLDLFSTETWQEFRENGSTVSGFSETRYKFVQRIKKGDYLLCYLTRASRWVGLLEVVGDPYNDTSLIWASQIFPCRVEVKPIVELDPEFGVPVLDMRDDLSVFRGLNNPNKWSGPFRASPAKWNASDGEAVCQALQGAAQHPVRRPLNKPARTTTPNVQVTLGEDAVIVPEPDLSLGIVSDAEASKHTEIQFLLMKLGADMGFDVHVARNDTGREWNGQRLGDMKRRRDQLPQTFDPATNRTIELIDLLWLDGNAIVAAFEIESTTSIYSGLLRMSDLLAMQPNISVPLFLVAPDDRRDKVIQQVNRPTFNRMTPPLVEICRSISFEALRDRLMEAQPYIKHLKPDWLQTISESCAPDAT